MAESPTIGNLRPITPKTRENVRRMTEESGITNKAFNAGSIIINEIDQRKTTL